MFLLLQKDWKNAKRCFLFDVSFSLGLLDVCVQGPADLSTVNQHVLWLTGRTGRVKATFTESLNTQRPCITKTIKIKEAKRQKAWYK